MKPEPRTGSGSCRRARLTAALSIIGAMTLACPLGCASRETRFHVVAFKNPEVEERYTQVFPEGAFAVDAGNRFDFVFERHDESPPPATAGPWTDPGDSTASGDAETLEPVALNQFISIKVLWRPRPGTTFAESTQTNAVISYCLLRGDHVISYEGAGFVYFSVSRDERSVAGSIESSTLIPTRSAGQPDDYFGPCHLSGEFRARLDKRQVVSVRHQMRRRLGPPVTAVNPEPVATSDSVP